MRNNQTRPSTAEDISDPLKTVGTGNKHLVAHDNGSRTCGRSNRRPGNPNDRPDRFIAGYQRISKARKRGHGAIPQEALGPGADATEPDFDLQIIGFERLEFERLQ